MLTVCENRAEEMLAIDEALMRLAAMDPQTGAACRVALLGRMPVEETALILKISAPTVKRR